MAVGVLGLDLQILLHHGGEFWHTNLSFCGNFGRGGEGLRFVREGSVRGRWVFCLAGGPSQNWGLHPDPRRRSRHSRGEKYVLAGGAGQNMISFSFPACGRGNSARRALPGESVGEERWVGTFGFFTGCRPDLLPYRASPLGGRGWDTLQGISHPQSLPLGGKVPQCAHWGG